MDQVVNSDLTNALLELLNATAVLIGDGDIPAGGGWAGAAGTSEFRGYVVLRRVPGGGTRDFDRGSITHPDSDGCTYYELIGAGSDREMAEVAVDIARNAVVGQRPAVPGRRIQSISVEEFGAAERNDTAVPGEPAAYFAADLVRVLSTPRAD